MVAPLFGHPDGLRTKLWIVATVLAIDDDPDLLAALRVMIESADYSFAAAGNAKDGLAEFFQLRPDLVLLDLGLPDVAGLDVLARIRDLSTTPVIILTASDGGPDKVRGLEAGADDYVTKPFAEDELLARVRAILRRSTAPISQAPESYEDAFIRVDFGRRSVWRNGEELRLTPIEYRLVEVLVTHPRQTLSRDQLLELVWDDTSGIGPERVKFGVMRLRRQLGLNGAPGEPLESIRGFGYRYLPPSGSA